MAVLVACEESQAVCCAFRELGVEAYSCDILPCSGGHPEWHIQQDCLPLLYSPLPTFKTSDGLLHSVRFSLLIAHPPCTYLSRAGSRHLYLQDGSFNLARYRLGLFAASFFYSCLKSPIKHICVENPVPLSLYGLPPHSQVIQPSNFGHPFLKTTYLWLKDLPPLIPTSCFLRSSIEPTRSAAWFNDLSGGEVARKSRRSKTFPGVAAAIANQWFKYGKEF